MAEIEPPHLLIDVRGQMLGGGTDVRPLQSPPEEVEETLHGVGGDDGIAKLSTQTLHVLARAVIDRAMLELVDDSKCSVIPQLSTIVASAGTSLAAPKG